MYTPDIDLLQLATVAWLMVPYDSSACDLIVASLQTLDSFVLAYDTPALLANLCALSVWSGARSALLVASGSSTADLTHYAALRSSRMQPWNHTHCAAP